METESKETESEENNVAVLDDLIDYDILERSKSEESNEPPDSNETG